MLKEMQQNVGGDVVGQVAGDDEPQSGRPCGELIQIEA